MPVDTRTLAAVIIIALIIVAVVVWLYMRKRHQDELKERWGPEYRRAVEQAHGDEQRATASLEAREQRVKQLHVRPLGPSDREGFASAWHAVQARFVDDPKAAVEQADRLICDVMTARGYPMADFEQRAADISVDHPQVVDNYRKAHGIAQQTERGQASTEDLRKAMVYYRALFEDLLETPEAARSEAERKEVRR